MNDHSTALVTGFPGWLGNRLVHFLHEPHPDFPPGTAQPRFDRVRCLVLPGTPAAAVTGRYPHVEVVEGDIRDPAAVGRFCAGAEGATVFHLAGLIHPKRISELFEINTQGTRHLLAAAAAAGVRRVVATSSNSPAGVNGSPEERFDESSPYKPYMAYGRSKKLMEDDLNAAHASGAVQTTILRPCWFYGPEQPPRQSEFFRMIKQGKAPIVGDGECRRSMSYVDNTSLGLLLAAASERAAGRTYWIADERPYSMNEIVGTVEELLEQEFGMEVAHDRMRLPSIASEVALAVDAVLQRGGLYQQKIHVLSEMNKTIACSVDKAREELGYAPGVELREGMRRSIRWCLDNGQEI
ncbi:MAG TPA: NAD-dependent epimerase/dehydratase family protein [Thermoleophilaceae bacterium]|nr:NAD-dependent epimerase/dehydratase family protein [Thermoleophilaceae bacterium]